MSLFGPSSLVTNSRRKQPAVRQYAAARPSRLQGDWLPVGQSVNDILRASSATLRARVRQLVRDFPFFARAINVQADFVVGSGTNYQARVLNPNWRPGGKESKFERSLCQRIEDAVSWWMEEADAAGRLHFAELERLAKTEDVEAGEFLFVKTFLKDRRRYLPFALQPIEAEWLSDMGAVPVGKNALDQGVEYDPETGRTIAYHIAAPENYLKSRRIPAEFVLHGFETRRSGQLRGVSPFVTAILIARDLDDYVGATIDTAKLAAKYLAIVTSDNISQFQTARATTDPDSGQKVETLENAIIEYLRPGEKIEFAKNENPGQTFDPFTRFILRVVAIATNTSYTLLTGDYSGSNYTTLRGERQDLLRMIAPQQQRHVRQFVAPAIREAITSAVLAGRIDLPGYFADPRPYWRAAYIPPGMEPVDPLRESKANRDDMAAGLRSPQEIAAKRGRDLEEIYDELAEAREMAAERSLMLEVGDTALANNPDKLGANEDDRADRARRIARDAAERAVLLMEE